MAPLLAAVPRKATDRSELQSEYLKYVFNFYCSCLYYVFCSSGSDIDKTLTRVMRQLAAQCTWSESAIGVMRNLLSSLLVKVLQVCDGAWEGWGGGR
jgi:hypothetical protein